MCPDVHYYAYRLYLVMAYGDADKKESALGDVINLHEEIYAFLSTFTINSWVKCLVL